MRASPSGSSARARPFFGWMRQRMPATRSLMLLMALRARGVSAKRRRFAGVGLGSAAARGVYESRIEGSGSVRRFSDVGLPAIRRKAPRNFSVIVMGDIRKARSTTEAQRHREIPLAFCLSRFWLEPQVSARGLGELAHLRGRGNRDL